MIRFIKRPGSQVMMVALNRCNLFLLFKWSHWIPAFAGRQWGIRIAYDTTMLQPSHASDDGFEVSSFSNVVWAQGETDNLQYERYACVSLCGDGSSC
jgi:hypothetical protein